MLVDPYVKFGASVPEIKSVVVYENFRETRFAGSPDEWIGQKLRESSTREEGVSDPDERWYLLEKFARISMRQYAIRSGKDNNDPAARTIFDSFWWQDLRELLERHGRLEVRDNPSASGPRSEWFHLVAGAEFLNPGSTVQTSTKEILEELKVHTRIGR